MNSLWTLQEEQKILISIDNGFNESTHTVQAKLFEVKIPAGQYKDSSDLIKVINDMIPDMVDFVAGIKTDDNKMLPLLIETKTNEAAVKFAMLSPSNPTVRATFASSRVTMNFPLGSESLRAMLGFNRSIEPYQRPLRRSRTQYFTPPLNWMGSPAPERLAQLKRVMAPDDDEPWHMTASRSFDAMVGNQMLYVYCSVADFSFLGNEKAQILRTLSTGGKHNEPKTERFDVGHYVPVLPSQFETIQVTIANESGENARFYSGKTLVKLHFRPYRDY